MRKLRTFVVQKNLSPDDQKAIADIDVTLDSLKNDARRLARLDRSEWREEAEAMGYGVGDMSAYVQWSSLYGHLRDIESLVKSIQSEEFKKKTILDRKYPEPEDREIVEAEFNYENPAMRLRYPTHGDFRYPTGDSFNITYLAILPIGSTALYDDRRAISWSLTLERIRTVVAGAMDATLDRNTQESKSIETEWGASASVSYGLFNAKASASEHKKITEEFKKGKEVKLGSKSTFHVGIEYLGWFEPKLFEHKHVKENIYPTFRAF